MDLSKDGWTDCAGDCNTALTTALAQPFIDKYGVYYCHHCALKRIVELEKP